MLFIEVLSILHKTLLDLVALFSCSPVCASRSHRQYSYRLSLLFATVFIAIFSILLLLLPSSSTPRWSRPVHLSSSASLQLHSLPIMEDHNTADPSLQPEVEGDMIPDVNQVFDRHWIAEDTEHQTPTHADVQGEVGNTFFSNSPVQPLSPRTTYAGPGTSSTSSAASGPQSVVDDGANQFSADLWNISPEERALMTNSARFARDRRRRRGAIHLDAPLELHSPPLSSPTSCFAPPSPVSPLVPPYCQIPHLSPVDNNPDIASPATPDANRAPPRGRLQRSFTPSERVDAGVAIVPGLLRRLARPFSGPWRGPSSPLASIPLADAPPASRLSRLRRLFSRRRRD
jgi:hypothetical protein